MAVLGLRTRLFIAMGLPLGVAHLGIGSCTPPEPAENPPTPPTPTLGDASPADVGAEAAWSLNIETPTEAGVDASAETDASDASTAIATIEAGTTDARAPKPRKRGPGWDARYKLAPGQEKWCQWGNTLCSRAEDVVGMNDGKKFGCPTVIQVPCPCNAGGCAKGPDAMCAAPLYAPVTFRERAKVKNACCYDLPRQCVPPWVGRPLVAANGEPLLAESVRRDDWHGSFDSSELENASAELRAARAEVWSRIAALEHASVASFAKVSLQLLALGAPLDLVMDTHQAALDEIEHARLAYAVASASGDHALGPGPLAIETLDVDAPTLADLAEETFRDGCVVETLGVVKARALLADETSPTLSAVLERIVSDEERHAELAWRTVAWALRTGGHSVEARIERELARAVRKTEPETLRSEVMRVLIEPCARALLASTELPVSAALI